MSEEPKRRPIVLLTGPAVEAYGVYRPACLLVAWRGSQIEIKVIEEKGAELGILLAREQASELVAALTATLANPPGN